jgi:signal transduction histidine kinase
VTDQAHGSILLSEIPASPGQRRRALAVSVLLFAGFLGILPFARVAWVPFPAFILIQQTLLLANDLITAALLFGQYAIGRTRPLNTLATGYLFTGADCHSPCAEFPGAFSETGLLGAGPQSAAWLYVGWHAVLPLAIMVFALRRDYAGGADEPVNTARTSIMMASLAAIGGVLAMTLLVTAGHAWLPPVIEDGQFTPATRVAVGMLLILPLGALLLLGRRRFRSMLDLWLMVVMFAWLCTICLGAFVSGGRYDTGWYVGRIFDLLTSMFILLVLPSETIGLYARHIRAAAIERRERERRLNEMESVLVHLSRVSALGQNVSTLAHEINQPLTAIFNYAAASVELINGSKIKQATSIMERLIEQTRRAASIIENLRKFIARQETEKHVVNIYEIIDNAVRLALTASGERDVSVNIRVEPDASLAFLDRVQIEQVHATP